MIGSAPGHDPPMGLSSSGIAALTEIPAMRGLDHPDVAWTPDAPPPPHGSTATIALILPVRDDHQRRTVVRRRLPPIRYPA
jgi:hypothetical protein